MLLSNDEDTMRRSICSCEPNVFCAGETTSWTLNFTTATSLPKGTLIKLDLLSQGREMDWEIPSCLSKDKKNVIILKLPNGKTAQAKPSDGGCEFTLPTEIKSGETLSCVFTDNRVQTNTQRRRPFHLYIDPKSKGDFKDPEIFSVDVRGGPLENIRIFTPSLVGKGKRFDVTLRFEDSYQNLTNNAPADTLIELSYENLRENLSWKLFVPETGFILLPNLYFNEPGVYIIRLKNMRTGDLFFSTPIKCLADTQQSIFWGLLHGETEKIDASEHIETCVRHLRDEQGLQFFGTSPFENTEETSADAWKHISTCIAESNEETRFTTLLGFQWFNAAPDEGLRQILYFKDAKPLLRKKDVKYSSLKKIYKSHTPKEILSIPCFSMGSGIETTFEDFSPEFERVVEIYNAWGSSECTEEEGNDRPITANSAEGISSSKKGSIRAALEKGHRFGFVAGGLDDRGIYSGLYEAEQEQYSPGLTAIIAKELSRDGLQQALMQRSCYATTGARMVIGFFIAGTPMGGELSTQAKPGLAFNRHITGYVATPSPIKEITIIRNGKHIHSFHPGSSVWECAFDDTEHLNNIALQRAGAACFAYYYLRVIQEDGHMGWSSPIWIDYPDIQPSPAKKPKKNT